MTEVRILRGVKVEDGYLGHPDFLPAITVSGALTVSLVGPNGSSIDLRPGAEEWALPQRELNGEFVLVAEVGHQEIRRRATFYGQPASENPKQPEVPEGYLLEHLASAVSLTDLIDETATTGAVLGWFEADADEYLGRDVGVFVTARDGATWILTHLGSSAFVRRLHPEVDVTPRARVADDGLRRTWRKRLARAKAHHLDPDGQRVARGIASANHKDLPLGPGTGIRPRRGGDIRATNRGTGGVLEALIAVTNRRLGLSRASWLQLLQTELHVEDSELLFVERAWAEAGLVRELVNVRSGSRLLSAILPSLLVFRTDGWHAATMLGTVLPSTRRRVLSTAEKAGCIAFEQSGPSPLLPPLLSIRAGAWEQLAELGRDLGLPLLRLPDEPLIPRARDLTSTPPQGYERADFGQTANVPDGIRMTRYWRSRAPQYWLIESETHTTWSHHERSALFWAYVLSKREVITVEKDGLIVDPAVAPLALARWLTALSGMPPGLDAPTAKYMIRTPGRAVSLEAVTFLQKYVDQVLGRLARTEWRHLG